MSMIKLEIADYNESVCRHIGAALVAIANDLAGWERQPGCGTHSPGVGRIDGGRVQGYAGKDDKAEVEIPVPANAVHIVEPITPVPPAPPLDDDSSWPAPPGGTTLDADGIPWDNRIHAASKTQCKDGTWKLRPGVDKDLVAQVKAQLRGVQELPVPAPPVADPAAALFAPPPPPPPAPTAPADCPATFAELIKALTPRLTAGTLTADQVNAACQTVGLATCNLLAARQDLIPAVWSQLQ